MITDNWYRAVCGNCRTGTLFFTKQLPDVRSKPVYQYAIKNDFTPASQEEPYCDTCGFSWTRYKPLVEDAHIVEDKCIVGLLDSIQEER